MWKLAIWIGELPARKSFSSANTWWLELAANRSPSLVRLYEDPASTVPEKYTTDGAFLSVTWRYAGSVVERGEPAKSEQSNWSNGWIVKLWSHAPPLYLTPMRVAPTSHRSAIGRIRSHSPVMPFASGVVKAVVEHSTSTSIPH